MTVHGGEELAREGRLVRAHTRASLMSDAKWRKLFTVLGQREFSIRECVWKIVGRTDEVRGHVPRSNYFQTPSPWVDTLDFGLMPLRSIEWLLIPRRTTVGYEIQDVDAAVAALQEVGRFPIEVDDSGMKVIGYLADTPNGSI